MTRDWELTLRGYFDFPRVPSSSAMPPLQQRKRVVHWPRADFACTLFISSKEELSMTSNQVAPPGM